jgi:hypothetical protein
MYIYIWLELRDKGESFWYIHQICYLYVNTYVCVYVQSYVYVCYVFINNCIY